MVEVVGEGSGFFLLVEVLEVGNFTAKLLRYLDLYQFDRTPKLVFKRYLRILKVIE